MVIRRRRPFSLMFALSCLVYGFLLAQFRTQLATWLLKDPSQTGALSASAVIFVLVGTGMVLYLYLKGDIGLPFLDKFVDTNPYKLSVDPVTESKLFELQSQI